MPSRYDQLESPYLRRVMSQTAFADRAVVDDLIRLREYLLKGCRGMASALHYRALQEKYPHAVVELLNESAPDRAQAWLAGRAENRTTLREAARRREKQTNNERRDWLEAGGQP